MKKHTVPVGRLLALGIVASGLLSACERSQTPPPPTVLKSEEPDRSSQPEAPKLPYGAAAPMAPGTDGVRPQVVVVESNVSPAVAASSPDNAASASQMGAAQPPATVPLSATEMTFITQAMDAGLFDLRVSQLAADRANDSMVKSYAALLVTDQMALNNGLQQLARQLGVPLQDSLSEPKQRVLDGLARTGELEFDRQFMGAAGVLEHQTTIELFERTGRETRNPVVQAFVLATLPTLRAHLSAAQRLPTHG